MKKAKIIMLSIIVTTVAGSAFSFKTAYSGTYCYAFVPKGSTCALQAPLCEATPLTGWRADGTGIELCYQIKGSIAFCQNQTCPNQSFMQEE